MRYCAFSASVLATLSVAGLLAGCNKSGGSASGEFLKTKSGLEYRLFRKDAAGKWQPLQLADLTKIDTAKQLRPGKVMLLEQIAVNDKDSVLQNTLETGMPQPYMLNPQPAQLVEEPMRMLAAGDSGVFRLPTDSIFKKMPPQARPKFLPKGSFVTLRLRANDVLTMPAAQAKMQELQSTAAKKQDAKDATILADYVKAHPELAAAQKTPSGVYVLITQPGTGPKPEPGQQVAVSYRGTLLNGTEFDASLRDGKDQPYEYPYGQGQVIPGWDEGVGMLSKDAKATILVPSSLGYGMRGSPPRIPANSPLRFDVQLQNISGKAVLPPAPMPVPGADGSADAR